METTQRLDGWEQRLNEYIKARSSTRFTWGSHDCCAFTAGAFAELTGNDPMVAHAGYSTPLGAARVIKAAGGIAEIPVMHGAIPLESWKLARRGDIVLIELDGRESLGVCVGISSAFASSDGVAMRPTSQCKAAWRVN